MPRRRTGATAPVLAGRILSRDELRRRGVTSRRLAGDEFRTVFTGFSTPRAHPASVREMCRTLLGDVLPDAVLSHTTAAAMMGIALPVTVDGGVVLHLPRAVPKRDGSPRPTRPGERCRDIAPVRLHCRTATSIHRSVGTSVVIHRMSPGPVVSRWGLRLSHPYEVLCELSGILGYADLVAAIDSVIGPGFPLVGASVREIERYLAGHGPFRHRRHLVRALAAARPGVESPGETFTRLLVVAAGFPEPCPNVPQWDPIAGALRRIDNAYPDQKLGIEFDGDVHRTARGAWIADEARRDGLAAQGWLLRRLTGGDLARPDPFLRRLHRACLERGVPAPPLGSWAGRQLLDGAAGLRPRGSDPGEE